VVALVSAVNLRMPALIPSILMRLESMEKAGENNEVFGYLFAECLFAFLKGELN